MTTTHNSKKLPLTTILIAGLVVIASLTAICGHVHLDNVVKKEARWWEGQILDNIATYKILILVNNLIDKTTETPNEDQLWQKIWQEWTTHNPTKSAAIKNGFDLRNHWEKQIHKTIHIGTLTTKSTTLPN